MKKVLNTTSMADMIIATDGESFYVFEDEDSFEKSKHLREFATKEECLAFIGGIQWVVMKRLFGGYKT